MKKRKGAALPLAIFLCVFLLIVTISVGTILLMTSASNKVNSVKTTHELIYAKANNQFINEQEITDRTFKWEIYEKEDDTNIKALAAYAKNDEMRFYSIYDFANDELLAYQTSNFYIVTIGVDEYLGGLVKVSRS